MSTSVVHRRTSLAVLGLLFVCSATTAAQVISYQEGDGKGTVSETDDTRIEEAAPDTNFGVETTLTIDQSPHQHVLLRFPNIIGTGANQIPPGSVILSASLTLNVTNDGTDCPIVYQLTQDWGESEATWSSRRAGFGWGNAGADGPASHKSTADGVLPCLTIGFQSVDVTASVQNWSNGDANEGWVLVDDASNNGIDVDSSETPTAALRPQLTVSFAPAIFYSVGTNVGDLKAGAPTVTIADGVATFDVPQPDNVGVGDEVSYGGVDVAYISSRASSTVFAMRTATGGIPPPVVAAPVSAIRRAFNSLSEAETSSSDGNHLGTQDLTAAGLQLHWACYDDGPLDDRVDLAGWTTDAQHYIRIFAPALPSEVGVSQRHTGVAGTGFRLVPTQPAPGAFFSILDIRAEHVRVEGIEIDGTSVTGGENVNGVFVSGIPTAGTDLRFEGLIVHGMTNSTVDDSDASFCRGISIQDGNAKISNTIVYDITNVSTHPTSFAIGIELAEATAIQYVHNVTVFDIKQTAGAGGAEADGIADWSSVTTVRNSFVGDIDSATGSESCYRLVGTQSNNVSSDATAAGAGSQTSQTVYPFYFRSITPGSEDLHLRQDSGTLWGAFGTDLSNDPNAPVTRDIDGQSRQTPTPDIGADELDAPVVLHRSVGTFSGDLNTGFHSVQISGTTATFSGTMPDNVGVGDVLEYQVLAIPYVAFIQRRISASVYMVSDAGGAAPQPAPAGTGVSVYRAYNSLFAWEVQDENDSLDNAVENFDTTTDLVGSNAILSVAGYGDGVDSTSVTINGWTTGPDNYIRIYTPFATTEVGASQRHAGRWDPTKYHLEAGTMSLRIEDEYVRLDGLQIRQTASSGFASGVQIAGGSGPSEYMVSNSIIRGDGVGILGFHMGLELGLAGSGTLWVWNNLFYDFVDSAITIGAGMALGDTDFNCYVYNNTIAHNTSGIEASCGTLVAKNNLAYNNSSNYSGAYDASSTHNLSGPSQAGAPGLNPRNATIVTFVNEAGDDFHLSPADSGARDQGANLSGDPNLAFADDIDAGPRIGTWDIGADEAGASGGAPTLTSITNQSFTVGSSPQPAALFTVTEALLASTINTLDDLRVRVPAGVSMRWDNAVTSVTVGGPHAVNVDGSVVSYEDNDRTVVLDVVNDFQPGDQITITGLWFRSFAAPSGPANLELEVANDDIVTALDDKTLAITAGTAPNLSSDDSRVFSLGAAPTAASPITITDGTTAVIDDITDIRIRIPDGVEMRWDSSVTSITVSGTAAGDVATAVTYEDSDRTLVIDVMTPGGFAPGTYLRVQDLEFAGFDAVSPPGFLELELDDADTVADLDDETVAIGGLGDVEVLTATSTDQQVLLEWVNPRYGSYASTRILRKRETDGCPSGPADASAVVVYDNGAVGLAAKDSFIDLVPDAPPCPASLCNDVTYCYVAYVDDGASNFSSGKPVTARPFDTSGAVKWAYSTGAATLSPPGLGRHGSGLLAVYQASNDRFLHAIQAGLSGGMWPTGPDWLPFKMQEPAQHRPAVVSVPVGAASRVAYLGSQDGHVYAVDADTGDLIWKSPTLGDGVQAAPAGIFTAPPYSAAYDLILVGSRNPSGPNAFYGLKLDDGTIEWTFDNGGTGIGMVNGGAAMNYAANEVCFGSHELNAGDDTIWCLSFSFSGTWTILSSWSDAIGDVSGSPMLFGGKLFVGTDAGSVHAYDASGGTPLWNQPLGDGTVKGFVFPHFGADQLFLSTTTTLHCLDDASGGAPCSFSWPEAGVGLPSTPLHVPYTTMVFVGSSDGNLYQLKTDNLTAPLAIQLGDGGATVGAPTFDLLNDLVYVGTDEGVIYAVVPQP